MISEKQIEQALINKLKDLKYTYREDICDKAVLETNFREHFQSLNKVNLNDSEFSRLRDEIITADVFTAAKILRQTNTFIRDDDTPLQYTLVNIKDWCKNEYEVIRQLQINTEYSHHRYDVIILINGVPVVQIELKSLQITPKRAMEQIVEYKNDPGNGFTNSLLCFMQLFIVSNETNTWYFSNNHKDHFSFNADERYLPIYQLADEANRKITHLHEFAEKILAKCTLGQMISRYMVLVASEQKLMIMRPYQIYAVKAIVDCIHQNRGNGYIWHTTGSGKTLTSFKAATLLKDNPDIEKCLFVVDRKDLDKQTREEFNKFQQGCVEENTNTEVLVRRLLSEDYSDKVIVATIQKLGLALDENGKRNQGQKQMGKPSFKERLEPLRAKRMVIIFDECHRSQFGENHQAIREFFPKAQLFGFTGTPIFEENSTYRRIDGTQASFVTTKDIFEKQLHAYTITNAIDDGNVLRFHIDYFKPEGKKQANTDATVSKRAVVDAILDKHDAATSSRRFNAILATASINDAIDYYHQFKTVQAERLQENGEYHPLNVACVFSPPADGNKDVAQIQEDLPQEKADNEEEPDKKKEALKAIIADYNKQYGTNHRLNEFDFYYQDIQNRIKDQKYPNADYLHNNKIDVVIVVDMLLTGFDAVYLNTLYVDKNLKHHGLIQAFSRTNRVLNVSKPYGNILDFRKQTAETDEAIALFSGQEINRAKQIWLVDPSPVIVKKLDIAVRELEKYMKSQGVPCLPMEVSNLKGDAAKIGFIAKFKEVQRLKTQLDQYTDLSEADRVIMEARMPEDTMRAFRGAYLETAQRLREQRGTKSDGDHPDAGQLDFEFVLFSSAVIDYDYIMKLIAKYTQGEPSKQKMNREQLVGLLCSSSNLMEEREDIADYINALQAGVVLSEKEIREGYQEFKSDKIAQEMAATAKKHGLKTQALQTFTDDIIDRMIFNGEKLVELMAPLGLCWKKRIKKELELMEDLIPLLKKLSGGRVIAGLAAYE
jgi:type I restriction enzyme R subunit